MKAISPPRFCPKPLMGLLFLISLWGTMGTRSAEGAPTQPTYDFILDGSQVVPPTGSTATAVAHMVLSPDNILSYTITATGLAGGAAALLHVGPPGTNGAVVFSLAGGPTTWNGTLQLSSTARWLLAGLLYVDIVTEGNPRGEIRGQIKAPDGPAAVGNVIAANGSTSDTEEAQTPTGQKNDTVCQATERPGSGLVAPGAGQPGVSLIKSGTVQDKEVPKADPEDTGLQMDLSGGEDGIRRVDLRVPGRGLDWECARRYRSRIIHNGPLGPNWEFNYHSRIILDPVTGNLELFDGNGRADTYVRQVDGSYQAPVGFYTRLTVIQGDPLNPSAGPVEVEIANRHMIRTTFRTQTTTHPLPYAILPITRVQDRNGNTMQFLYGDPQDPFRLKKVIDTLGREYLYLYDTQGRLETVRDFMGREIVMAYGTSGALQSVRSPKVIGTPLVGGNPINDFMNGKTETYGYDVTSSDAKLLFNLTSIKAPNELSAGPARVTFTYETAPSSPDFDKVLTQTLSGTNGSGVPAGGTIGYAYAPASGPNGAVSKTTVTDRNANVTEYYFDAAGHPVALREFTSGDHPGEPAYYETQHDYNADGELTQTVHPNQDVIDYVYDSGNADRPQQGNLLSATVTPGPLGGDQTFLTRTYTYEPIYNYLRTKVEERGNDPLYAPQNGGPWSPARYTTTYVFDYQEGDNSAELAANTGLSQAQVQALIAASRIPTNLGDQNGDGVTVAPANARGSIVRLVQPTANLLAGSPQALAEGDTVQDIFTMTQYNLFGQKTRQIDPEENVHEFFYYPENDPDGDGADILVTNGAGLPSNAATGGYLKQMARDTTLSAGRETFQDPPETNIRIDYFYDKVGNVIHTLDGRGIETRFFVNELNQVVEITRAADVSAVPGRLGGANGSAENLTGQAFQYRVLFVRDANNNVTGKLVENRDGNTPDGGVHPGFIEYGFAYDILDDLITETQEVSDSVTLTWQHRYDANQNRRATLFPEGNVFAWAWDERDLPLAMTRGVGTPEESTVTYDLYDGNRNLLLSRDAEDNNNDGLGDPTTRTYDGYNRLATLRDAVGGVREIHYDPASNAVLEMRFGQIGGPSPTNDSGAGNVLLSQDERMVDELSRTFQTDRVLFVSAGVVPTRPVTLQDGPLTPGDLKVSTRMDYDRLGRLRFRTEDDLDQYRADYDGASRVIHAYDGENNEVLTDYDDDSNPVRKETVEKHPEGTVATQHFVSLARFDGLNRPTTAITNLGNTHRAVYDSRDNVVEATDAQGPPSTETVMTTQLVTLNLPGNRTRTFYDGINRGLRVEHDMTVDGQGGSAPDPANPVIALAQLWDGNSRLTDQTDDRGNTTHYTYDPLNRKKTETFADRRSVTRTFDKDDNVRTLTDQNGSARTLTYDGVSRLVDCSVARGAGVVGTTLQAWEYDGLSRTTRATDNNEPATTADDSVVTMAYDSLSRLLEEHQILDGNDKIVSDDWQDDGLRTNLVYPNDRKVGFTWDGLDRLKTVTNVAGYEYIGPGRLLKRTYQNGTFLTLTDNTGTQAAGYDGDRRVMQQRHFLGVALLAGFNDSYDRMDNRLSEERPHMPASRRSDAFVMDSRYRLLDQKRDIPQGGGIPLEERTWSLDGAGNWASLSISVNGGAPTVLTQAMDALNSYTSFGGVGQTDDLNGNRTDDGSKLYAWDFLNRLREVRRSSDGAPVARYLHDAWGANGMLGGSGRRIRKEAFLLPIQLQTGEIQEEEEAEPALRRSLTRFLYDGWRVIEERNAQDLVTQQYVDGGWLDEHLTMDQYNSDGVTLKRTLFYHENSQGWIHALTDAGGAVVERYTYDAYGKPAFQNAAGAPLPNQKRSAVGNPYTYCGLRLDSESGLIYGRHRYYSPGQGRWLSRDPIGLYGDGINAGNGYGYVGSNPTRFKDPFGLMPNQEDAIGLDEFLQRVRLISKANPDLDNGELMEYIKDMIKGGGSAFGDIGPSSVSGSGSSSSNSQPSGSASSGKRCVNATLGWNYIYTTRFGWIDLGHFFTASDWGQALPGEDFAIGTVYIAGVGVEMQQRLNYYSPWANPSAYGSAFTPEDIPSNSAGAFFGATLDPNIPLDVQLKKFFLSLGAVNNPSSAPGFKSLPTSEAQWENWQRQRRSAKLKNHWYSGILGE